MALIKTSAQGLAADATDFVRLGFGSGSGASQISVDFFSDTYDVYKIFLTGVNGSSTSGIVQMRVNTSAGNSQNVSNYRSVYDGGYRNNAGSTADKRLSNWDNAHSSIGNVSPHAYETSNFEITVFKPFSSSTRTRFIVTGGGYTSNQIQGLAGQGVYNATESHTGLSFIVSTGTLSISHIEVYGIK